MTNTDSIDVIVLAGNKGAARNFPDCNKALLKVGGEPLIQKVIDALQAVSHVERIVVVGPVAELEFLPANVTLLEQEQTIYQNFWKGFTALSSSHAIDKEPVPDSEALNKAVLVVPSDMPFPSHTEIAGFIDACIHRNLDYGVGMTDQQSLNRYRPIDGKPGLVFQFLHLDDGSLRLNNLHYVKPFQLVNRDYVHRIYELRYQRDILNILGVSSDLVFRHGLGLSAIYTYLLLQLANLAHRNNNQRLLRWAKIKLPRSHITDIACRLLGGKTEIVETSEGRCAIDIDNEQDLITVQERYEEYLIDS